GARGQGRARQPRARRWAEVKRWRGADLGAVCELVSGQPPRPGGRSTRAFSTMFGTYADWNRAHLTWGEGPRGVKLGVFAVAATAAGRQDRAAEPAPDAGPGAGGELCRDAAGGQIGQRSSDDRPGRGGSRRRRQADAARGGPPGRTAGAERAGRALAA